MKIPFGPIYFGVVIVLSQYLRQCGDTQKKMRW